MVLTLFCYTSLMIYKNTRQRIIVVLVLLAVVLLAKYVLYPWLEKTQNPPLNTDNQVNPQVTEKTIPEPSLPHNTEWKIYTDKEEGFQFKYPSNAVINYNGGIKVSTSDGQYFFNVSTSTKAGYRSSPTLHTQYRYTYNVAKNTFSAEDGFSPRQNIIKDACPESRETGSVVSPMHYYVGHLSGRENGGGNDDVNYFLITNKDHVIDLAFMDGSKASIESLNSFKLIGDTSQIYASCPQ